MRNLWPSSGNSRRRHFKSNPAVDKAPRDCKALRHRYEQSSQEFSKPIRRATFSVSTMASSFQIEDLLGLSREERAEPAAAGCSDPSPAVSSPARTSAADSVGNSSSSEDSSYSESESICACSANGAHREQGPRSKRLRTAFTAAQLRALEYSFRVCPYPDSYAREQIARTTAIDEAKIQVGSRCTLQVLCVCGVRSAVVAISVPQTSI